MGYAQQPMQWQPMGTDSMEWEFDAGVFWFHMLKTQVYDSELKATSTSYEWRCHFDGLPSACAGDYDSPEGCQLDAQEFWDRIWKSVSKEAL